MLRYGEEVLLQLGAGQCGADRDAVVDDVEVGRPKIDDAAARAVLDERVAYVPLLGTTQSKTCVPVGTSQTVRGTSRPIRRRVSRNPSPVMLRQIGYSSAISPYISAPRFSGTGLEKLPASIWLSGF